MKKNIFVISILFLLSNYISAAVPSAPWVINALNNIRRTIQQIKNGKHINKFIKLGKLANSLPEEEINTFCKIAAKPNGLKELNQILGKANYIGKYGDELGHIILQDTYLRIALKNGKLSEKIAKDALKHLGGTPGFTSLLSKINSCNASQVKGHLRELQIALQAEKRGYSTISLGQKFADGLKKGDTDLDVFIRRNNKNFAIESKAYSGLVPDTMIKADAESLAAFCKEIDNTIPIFCFETAPSKLSQSFLMQRGVRCLVGTPEEIISKLDIISNLY